MVSSCPQHHHRQPCRSRAFHRPWCRRCWSSTSFRSCPTAIGCALSRTCRTLPRRLWCCSTRLCSWLWCRFHSQYLRKERFTVKQIYKTYLGGCDDGIFLKWYPKFEQTCGISEDQCIFPDHKPLTSIPSCEVRRQIRQKGISTLFFLQTKHNTAIININCIDFWLKDLPVKRGQMRLHTVMHPLLWNCPSASSR